MKISNQGSLPLFADTFDPNVVVLQNDVGHMILLFQNYVTDPIQNHKNLTKTFQTYSRLSFDRLRCRQSGQEVLKCLEREKRCLFANLLP